MLFGHGRKEQPSDAPPIGLVQRSGDLKAALRKFGDKREFRWEFTQAVQDYCGGPPEDPTIEVNAEDYFLTQHRLSDGRLLVEHFLEAHPDLPEAEREMLLGWHDVVEGVFEIQRNDGDSVLATNLIDELEYRFRSNRGPEAVEVVRPGWFLYTRLVPVAGEWVLSGAGNPLPPEARAEVYRLAAMMAMRKPSWVYRSPEKRESGWRLQREQRAAFVEFFGSDMVILTPAEFPKRIKDYMRYRTFEAVGEDGRTVADRAREQYGMVPGEPDFPDPEGLDEWDSVGIIYDEVEGMDFFPELGLLAEVFARPELVERERYLEVVDEYLSSPDISPVPLRRLAAANPERADRIFRVITEEPDFRWERDGEDLLREYKAERMDEEPLPSVVVMSPNLSKALREPKPGAKPDVGRNDPCPCGSGKKYKKCCGA